MINNNQLRVQMVLNLLGITSSVQPRAKLSALIRAVQESRSQDGSYMYLMDGSGKYLAHGKYPGLVQLGSIIQYDNYPELKEAVMIVLRRSYFTGAFATYSWETSIKTAYVITLNFDGETVVLGC